MRAADDGARVAGAYEAERCLDIGDGGAAGCGFDAPRDKSVARHGVDRENINRSCDRRIAGGDFTNGITVRRLLRVVPDNKRITDENGTDGAAIECYGSFDGDFRADTVGIADGKRDRSMRSAQSGNASKVSIRELSQTTIRSASLALSPFSR